MSWTQMKNAQGKKYFCTWTAQMVMLILRLVNFPFTSSLFLVQQESPSSNWWRHTAGAKTSSRACLRNLEETDTVKEILEQSRLTKGCNEFVWKTCGGSQEKARSIQQCAPPIGQRNNEPDEEKKQPDITGSAKLRKRSRKNWKQQKKKEKRKIVVQYVDREKRKTKSRCCFFIWKDAMIDIDFIYLYLVILLILITIL